MPAKPRWLLAIPDAISQLEQLVRQLLTRRDIERLFGVGKVRAAALMKTFGAELVGNQRTLPRTRLLQQLKKHRGRAAFRVEEERRARVAAELQKARLTGVRFKVPVETMRRSWRTCPMGCRSSAGGSRCGSTGRRTPWRGCTPWPRRSGTIWRGSRRSSVVESAGRGSDGMTTKALVPSAVEPAIATGGRGDIVLPQVIVDAGPSAVARFLEFFAGRIANARTRAAYGRAVGARPRAPRRLPAPRGRLHPDAPGIGADGEAAPDRDPNARLVVSQVLPSNPAAAVRGPKHVVTKGATPVLSPAEARKLLKSIDTGALAGLRDRALLSVMLHSFARVSGVLGCVGRTTSGRRAGAC